MTGRVAWFTVGHAACVSFLVGMVMTGSMTAANAVTTPTVVMARNLRNDRPFVPDIAGVVNFADVFEQLNPAVVNIDTSVRVRRSARPSQDGRSQPRDLLDDQF